jgi:ribosomal protein L11 methyltransferase
MTGELYAWRRVSTARWEDVWPERLSEFSDRLAITSLAGKPRIRVEVFAISKGDANRLTKAFGGIAAKQRRDVPVGTKQRIPINVRGRLSIVSSDSERSTVRGNAPVLVIPAGMAFGTGEHATTLNCLRFLVDFATTRAGAEWTALDLGCGSGILALAARQLGARQVLAADFDSECVRITRENSRANGLRSVTIRKLDVLTWAPDSKFDLVAANLYSTILVAIAPKLAQSIAPGGMLVFSGVMRDQETDVTAAFKKAGLKVTETKRQGKWIAGTASLKK